MPKYSSYFHPHSQQLNSFTIMKFGSIALSPQYSHLYILVLPICAHVMMVDILFRCQIKYPLYITLFQNRARLYQMALAPFHNFIALYFERRKFASWLSSAEIQQGCERGRQCWISPRTLQKFDFLIQLLVSAKRFLFRPLNK